mmetsp:Transcript_15113/g.17119  ORF Transcript_15113/g.17119 Transcript_15113/m.17119 type:complete len:316 (+) Transcript_15113:76-1023(+)
MVALNDEEYAKRRKEALEHVEREQVKKCAKALLKHVSLVEKKKKEGKKRKADLFDEVENDSDRLVEHDTGKVVQLVFTLRSTPAESFKTLKGHKINIPNPLIKISKDLDVCLLVKDKAEVKKVLEEKSVESVQKVISLKQLRTQYHTFQAKRDLLATYDVFLADDRIVCMLPKTLGQIFYKGPKKPVPVRLFHRNKPLNFEKRIRDSLEATYFYLRGSCCSVKIGRTCFTLDQICENALETITTAVHHIPKRWQNVQAIHMKTGKSMSLPIYNSVPDLEDIEFVKPKEKEKEKITKTKKAVKKSPRKRRKVAKAK